MANEFYDPGEHHAERVKALFTRIALRYDRLNDLQSFGLHRYWKRRVVRLANPQPGELALDLCCGTGDLAFALAQRGAKVLGLDFTGLMLETAQRRKEQSRSSDLDAPKPYGTRHYTVRTPHFIQADALRTPFHDQSFDIVTIAYGLRNLADSRAGLREIQRLSKPGARLLVLDFGKPDNRLWRGLYFGYLKLFIPLLGQIFCGSASAYAYILESLKHYPAQRGVAVQMRELGLQNIRIINLLGGVMSINYAEKPH